MLSSAEDISAIPLKNLFKIKAKSITVIRNASKSRWIQIGTPPPPNKPVTKRRHATELAGLKAISGARCSPVNLSNKRNPFQYSYTIKWKDLHLISAFCFKYTRTKRGFIWRAPGFIFRSGSGDRCFKNNWTGASYLSLSEALTFCEAERKPSVSGKRANNACFYSKTWGIVETQKKLRELF